MKEGDFVSVLSHQKIEDHHLLSLNYNLSFFFFYVFYIFWELRRDSKLINLQLMNSLVIVYKCHLVSWWKGMFPLRYIIVSFFGCV